MSSRKNYTTQHGCVHDLKSNGQKFKNLKKEEKKNHNTRPCTSYTTVL